MSDRTFSRGKRAGDERGVAPVIGFILIFAILIVSFSIYQAHSVPNQNEQTEFQHMLGTVNEMDKVRSAILSTGGSGHSQAVSLQLGTGYQQRILAVNPPPATGTLETVGDDQISADAFSTSEICGDAEATTNRALVYEANYNHLQGNPQLVYENSVKYRAFDGRYVLDTGQSVINDDVINLIPIAGDEYYRHGTEAVSLEFRGGPVRTEVLQINDEFVLTLPSQLPAEVWEDELLQTELEDGKVVAVESSDSVTGVDITMSAGTYTVNCRAIGTDQSPPSGDAIVQFGAQDEIQPAGVGSVALTDAENHDDEYMELVFENLADEERSFNYSRISFYWAQDDDHPESAEIFEVDQGSGTATELHFPRGYGGGFVELEEPIIFPAGESTTVRIEFDDDIEDEQWFILAVRDNRGERIQYFVRVSGSV